MKEKGKLIESPQPSREMFEKWLEDFNKRPLPFKLDIATPAAIVAEESYKAGWQAHINAEAESLRQPSTDEREHFEKFMRLEFGESKFDKCPDPRCMDQGKHYREEFVDAAWRIWKAGAELREVSQHPVPAPQTSHRTWTEVKAEMDSKGEHPVPAPETQIQGDNAELVRMAEKLLEWMPIYSKGSSGNIRQTNLRAAIEKFKVEHPEPAKESHDDKI